jgi:N-acetylmuramoyl-L-alanine amidase
LANLENAADLVGGVQLRTQEDDLASVLLDISQTAVREASVDLASRLLSSLGRRFVLQKREPQQAGFAVLKSPDVPSVLIETAFLSDERDERMLASAEHQQALAQSLYSGIKSYFNAYRPQSAGDYTDVVPAAIQPKGKARRALPQSKSRTAR